MSLLTKWLIQKWRGRDATLLQRAYLDTFSTIAGQIVLQDLVDQIYCQPCPSLDPQQLAAHNGRRAVVHEILMNLDQAQQPDKYAAPITEGAPAWMNPLPPPQ